MKIVFSLRSISFLSAILFCFFLFFSAPQTTQAACTLANGGFRTASTTIQSSNSIPENWYTDTLTQTQAQPFLYLDLVFHADCVGSTASTVLTVIEYNTIEANTVLLGPITIPGSSFNSLNLDRTYIMKAGTKDCTSTGGCDITLEIQSPNAPPVHFWSNSLFPKLKLEYECSPYCLIGYGDFSNSNISNSSNINQPLIYYNWLAVPPGVVSKQTLPSYLYAKYLHPNDPAAGQGGITGSNTGGGITGGNEGGGITGTGDQDAPPLSVSDLEKIENPLGSGANLPNFIKSLLGIIMKAGIPLVVLAFVFSGFYFVYAQGKPDELKKAKEILLYTVIGSAVLLGAWTIVTILTNTLNLIITSIIIHLV